MKPLYPRLLAYCLPYRRGLAASLVCMVFAAGLGTVPPWLLKNVVDDVLIAKRGDLLNSLAFGIVGLYVLKALFSYGQTYLMTWVGQRVVMDIRISLYDRIQRLSFSFFHRRRIGELLSRVTNDTTTVQDILVNVVVDLVVQGTTFLGILGFLLFLNWRLTLATFAIIPLAVLVIDRTSKRLRDVGRSIQERLAGVSAVAQEALAAGAEIINDVTALEGDPRMRGVAVQAGAGLCLMHRQGTPRTMQDHPEYENVLEEVLGHLRARRDVAEAAGVARDRIALDPGIGFGKTTQHNLELLANAWRLHELGCPVLVGHSRKSFIGKVLADDACDPTAGTLGVSLALARQGVQLLRVHDVGLVRQALALFEAAGGYGHPPIA